VASDDGAAAALGPSRASPPKAKAEAPAGPEQADVDLDDPRSLVVAEADAESLTEEVSALDTLVDLAVTQPWGQAAQAATTLPGSRTNIMATAPPAPLCPVRPIPPRPWILTTVSRPGDGRGICILTPLRPSTILVERPQGHVTVSPLAQVDVAMRPPVMHDVSVGADQGAVAGAGAPVPAAAAVDSPTWAERVEEREAEVRDLSSSSEGDEGHQDQAPAPAPTRPVPAACQALQARDVILAVRNLTYLAEAAVLVPTLMQRFATDVSASELATRMEWLWLMRCEVATYLRDTALQGHMLNQSPEQTLADLFRAMDALCTDLR